MNENYQILHNKKLIAIILLVFLVIIVIMYVFKDNIIPNNSQKDQNTAVNNNPDKVSSFSNYLFSISSPSDSNEITINASSGYRNAAVNQIYKMGDDAIYYKIIFTDYNNPFEAYE